MKKFIIINLIILSLVLFSGCSEDTDIVNEEVNENVNNEETQEVESEKSEFFIDWREFTPKKEMVMYFEGGFENAGDFTAIEYIDEDYLIKRSVNTGKGESLHLYEIIDGIAVEVLYIMEDIAPDNIEEVLDINYKEHENYKEPEKHNIRFETDSKTWEEKRDYGDSIVKHEVLDMNFEMEINGQNYSGVKIGRTIIDDNDEDFITTELVYLKGLGLVSTEFIVDSDDEVIFYHRLLRYYELEADKTEMDIHEEMEFVADKYGYYLALPYYYDSIYSRGYLFIDKNEIDDQDVFEYKVKELDYNYNVFRSFETKEKNLDIEYKNDKIILKQFDNKTIIYDTETKELIEE